MAGLCPAVARPRCARAWSQRPRPYPPGGRGSWGSILRLSAAWGQALHVFHMKTHHQSERKVGGPWGAYSSAEGGSSAAVPPPPLPPPIYTHEDGPRTGLRGPCVCVCVPCGAAARVGSRGSLFYSLPYEKHHAARTHSPGARPRGKGRAVLGLHGRPGPLSDLAVRPCHVGPPLVGILPDLDTYEVDGLEAHGRCIV